MAQSSCALRFPLRFLFLLFLRSCGFSLHPLHFRFFYRDLTAEVHHAIPAAPISAEQWARSRSAIKSHGTPANQTSSPPDAARLPKIEKSVFFRPGTKWLGREWT